MCSAYHSQMEMTRIVETNPLYEGEKTTLETNSIFTNVTMQMQMQIII